VSTFNVPIRKGIAQKGVKSTTLDEIVEVTGHSKRRLIKVPFQHASRNKDLILIASVIEWLKTAPLPGNTDMFLAVKDAINGNEKQEQNGHTTETLQLDKFIDLSI
jgi:hypothetical protein